MSKQPIHLRSDRLHVEISQPGVTYAGTRFDWSGFITQVTLDGRHTFCVPEDYRPGMGTGGIGLCNEFGIDAALGYESTQPGEPFSKLGVGLLSRLDEREYSFWCPHQIAQHYPIEVVAESSRVVFTVQPLECHGYAARLTKAISVVGNQLRIDYLLENTGALPIQTNEYVHNFVGIDEQKFGPDYMVNFPIAPSIEEHTAENEILDLNGSHLTLKRVPGAAFYARLQGFVQTAKPQWELVHRPSGVAMREYDDFEPCRVAVWGDNHVLSVEIFTAIDIQPSENQKWSRRYEFIG